jgi:hypothetical protein
MKPPRWLVTAVLVALALSIFASVTSIVSLSKNPSSEKTVLSTHGSSLNIVSGIYSYRPLDQPHYYVIVDHVTTHGLSGSMNFRYQDGQSTVIFTFTGVGVGSDAVLTTTSYPETGAEISSPGERTKVPRTVSVTLGDHSIEFGECLSYLKFTMSYAQCTFKSVPRA